MMGAAEVLFSTHQAAPLLVPSRGDAARELRGRGGQSAVWRHASAGCAQSGDRRRNGHTRAARRPQDGSNKSRTQRCADARVCRQIRCARPACAAPRAMCSALITRDGAGCDEALWSKVDNKRFLLRLAMSGDAGRCRRQVERLSLSLSLTLSLTLTLTQVANPNPNPNPSSQP